MYFSSVMEAQVIKTFFPQLVTAISDCIHSVSDQCLAKGLVSDSTYRKILQLTGTNDDKARTLLSSILSITEGDHADSSTCFKQLLSVLDESLPPGSKRILSAMKEELDRRVAQSEMSDVSKRCVAQQETLSGRLEDSTRRHKVSKPLRNRVPKCMTLFEDKEQDDSCMSTATQTEVISNGFSAKAVVLHNDKEKDFHYLIKLDLKELKKKFITLQFEVRESLSKKVPPQKIVAHVLSDYEDVCENHDCKAISLFSGADQEKLNSATSVNQVFQVLRKYWSFLKCEILYSIVDHCGDESDRARVKDYQKQLEMFFNQRKVLEVPEELMTSSSVDGMRDKMLIKLDKENPPWTAITDLEFRICEILGIRPSALLIIGIREGCVEITFSIPKHVSQQIFSRPLTKEQQDQFRAESLLRLSCGHVHLTFEERNLIQSSEENDTRPLNPTDTSPHPLCQASTQPATCSPQQPTQTHTCSIDEDMDCHSNTSITPCPAATVSGEATLANGLTAEPEEFKVTTDYSIKLEDGKEVRKYQHELAEPGTKGENCIIVAPTGSGKTLVAALVISDHLQKNQHNDDKPNVLFIVNTRPLAEQQKKEIKRFIPNARVECSMGDGGPSVQELLPETDVVVCTAGKLLDSIKQGKVKYDQISLIVMDECHHTKKESCQANIMRRYIEYKEEGTSKFPQVIGLTASPGAGENPDLDEKKTIDHLVNLCAHMDATRGIVTVKKHQEELDRCTNKPSFTLEVLQRRDPQEPFIQMIVHEMEKLEKYVPFLKCAHLKWSQEYETKVQQEKAPLELSTNPKFRDQISTLSLLRRYSQALSIYMDLRSDDAISVLQGYDDLPFDDGQATAHEQNLKKALQQLIYSLSRLQPIENPLLNAAEEKLASVFGCNRDSKGIFFVRTKVHAQSICKWIASESLPIASKYSIHPRVLTGHRKETGVGMTQVAQEEVMESFRGGECNLLVATSVAEEGLDVPACNLVIRFQHVSNEIARVQTHGRARADESEGFTILSCDTKKKFQEMKNEMRLRLMEECMQWFPTGEHLIRMIKERQNEIIRRHQRKIAFRKQLISKQDRSDFQLKCKKCKTLACSGADVFLIEDSNHHMVPKKEFRTEKIVTRPHDHPRPISAEIAKTHKIFCAKCNADWGIMATWPTKGHQFPVLKCKSFIFEANGVPQPITKWSDAPFEVSVWMDLQDDESME